VWIGVSDGKSGLNEITSIVNEKLIRLGFPSEKRGFSPHLTVARVRSKREHYSLLTTIESFHDRFFGSQEVNEIKLKKSDLTPKGPIYTDLYVRKAKL
jgi:2'-5' RNA ligase